MTNGERTSVREPIQCPICKQDWVLLYRVRETHEQLWVCAECDSAWHSHESIAPETSEYLPNLLTDAWQALDRVGW